MRIRHPHENGRAAFLDFSTLRPVFKKVRFQGLCFQDLCGRSAKTMQYMCIFAKEVFRVDSLCLGGCVEWNGTSQLVIGVAGVFMHVIWRRIRLG